MTYFVGMPVAPGKAADHMRRVYLPLMVMLLGLGGVATAQVNTPPQFDTVYTTGSVAEGDLLSWDITVTDPDPTDSVILDINPPTDDPLYQGAVRLLEIETRVWNFQFDPFYDFIETGQVDVPFTIFATDGTDTAFMPVTITVVHYNPPPVIEPVTDHRITDGMNLQIPIIANDSDNTVPALSAEPTVANATFTDNGDGTGLFDFTPDATQAGQDFALSFIASDGEKADTEAVLITVVAYLPAILDVIPTQIVTEGKTLELDITGDDPNDIFLELSALDHPELDVTVGETVNDSAHLTIITNYVKQDTAYDLVYYAYNGRDTTFDTALVTVADSMNFPPVFESVDPFVIEEGTGFIEDYVITASDPEGNPVALSLVAADTIGVDSLYFEEIGNDSALFSFYPDITDGGNYIFRIMANDFLSGEADAAVETLAVGVTVVEVNYPPVLRLDTTGTVTGLREGGYVRFDIQATDVEQPVIDFTVFPPPDSAVYKGNVVFLNRGDGTGFFEFYPDYSQVVGATDTTYRIMFSTSDGIEEVNKLVVLTVYDVAPGANDPYDADTLTLVGSVWDSVTITDTVVTDTLGNDSIIVDTTFGFSITSRIWNDSNITAAMTGFRWSEPWLTCEEVTFGPRLVSGPDSAHFKTIYLNQDSLAFQLTFMYLEGESIAPDPGGGWEHFTARFVINTALLDPDTIDIDTMPKIRFDTASLGTSARFVFDKQAKYAASNEAIDQYLKLLTTTDLSYPPLVKLGEVRSATNAVRISIFDVKNGTTLGNGSSLYMFDDEDSVKQYEFRVSLENRRRLSGLSLGLRLSSEDGAWWQYGDSLPLVATASRMAPDTAVWNETGGLLLTGSSMDGIAEDTLTLAGGGTYPDAGLPRGLMEHMVKIPFSVGGVIRDETKTICFDTTAGVSGETWRFIAEDTDTLAPIGSGRICLPVRTRKVLKGEADSVVMVIYDVRAGTVLSPDSTLYMYDDDDSLKHYELRVSLENLRRLSEISLGFRIYSEDGALWEYTDSVPVAVAGSRMMPETQVWNQTNGLTYADTIIGGPPEDTLVLHGRATDFEQFGLHPGFMDHMVTIPFTVGGVIEGGEKTLCFDTTYTDSGNAWRFIRTVFDTVGPDSIIVDTVNPGFAGSICLPVRFKKPTGVDNGTPTLPALYSLAQNFPNPFNAATTIRFSIGAREQVLITVYNILGQTVQVLTDRVYPPGLHEVFWNGRDGRGRPAASGIYLYRIESKGIVETKKMILLK